MTTAWRPEILIVDETLLVGGMHFQARYYQHIQKFKEKGTTLLLASHSVDDVVKHYEHTIILKNGVVEIDGSARVVSNRYLDELFGKKRTNQKRRLHLCQP